MGNVHDPDRAKRRAARNAYSEAIRAYHKDTDPQVREGFDQLQFAHQAFLSAVGNVVKLLLPPERKMLRGLLHVDAASYKDVRHARNSFEHTAEEIDKRIRDGKALAFRNFGGSPFDDEATLRTYDPATDSIITNGKRIKLEPLHSELLRLRGELDHRNPAGAWERTWNAPTPPGRDRVRGG